MILDVGNLNDKLRNNTLNLTLILPRGGWENGCLFS